MNKHFLKNILTGHLVFEETPSMPLTELRTAFIRVQEDFVYLPTKCLYISS